MCKRCIIGVIIDSETNEIVYVFENEPIEPDIIFKYCPECGKKLS